MGFRFRKSIRIAPGIRLNFSKSGVSTSFGGKGFTLNVGPKGTRATVGIPGTGISYSETLASTPRPSGPAHAPVVLDDLAPDYSQPAARASSHSWPGIVFLFLLLACFVMPQQAGGLAIAMVLVGSVQVYYWMTGQ